MATIREIADRAGVSLGTVDRVLHNRGRVSSETKQRIQQVIEDLGYTPDLFARHLSTSRSYNFGVLMPGIEQDGGYWRLPWQGMQQSAQNHRAYRISLETAFFDRYKPESFRRAHQKLCQAGVDGILMAPVVPQAALEVLDQANLPVHISFDVSLNHPVVCSHIGQDSERSGRLAARLMRLLCPGGGTVGILQPDTDNMHIGLRVAGIKSVMTDQTYRVITRIHPADGSVASYQQCLKTLIQEQSDLCGILVVDSTTHLVASALAKIHFDHLPIIGYDLMSEDIPWLEKQTISFLLTQDPIGQGRAGIDALFNRIVMNHELKPRITVPLNIVTVDNYQDFLTD